jgi:hypothetical protein
MRNEVLLALVVTAAFVFWYYFADGVVVVNRVLAQNRGQVYGTLASILANLLGFVIAAVTILLTLWPMKALKLLKDSAHAETLWVLMKSAMRWLALSTVACLVAMLLDRDAAPEPLLLHVTIFFLAVTLFRIVRTIWVLERVIDIVTWRDAA